MPPNRPNPGAWQAHGAREIVRLGSQNDAPNTTAILEDQDDDSPGGLRPIGEVAHQAIWIMALQALLGTIRRGRAFQLDVAPWVWHGRGTAALDASADELSDAEAWVLDLIAEARR